MGVGITLPLSGRQGAWGCAEEGDGGLSTRRGCSASHTLDSDLYLALISDLVLMFCFMPFWSSCGS